MKHTVNKDTIRHCAPFYYSKPKQLHVSAVLRQTSSGRKFQKCEIKMDYIVSDGEYTGTTGMAHIQIGAHYVPCEV